jgi:drug/metabolite transporter (DMT)-like permease
MSETLELYLGHIAGVTTAVLWTATTLFFTAAGKRIGTTMVNSLRIVAAIVLLAITHRLINGCWMPSAVAGQVFYLAISGVVGLSIGDQALFAAFVEIGPRLSSLVMTTSPLWAAFLGWLVLGEALEGWAWLGMGMTISGIAWVVLERPAVTMNQPAPRRLRGVLFALVGATCQAGGLMLSKKGMGHGWLPDGDHVPPQTATLIRMSFAALGMIPIVLVHRAGQRKKRTAGTLPTRLGSRRTGFLFTCGGAIVGPFLGVWMSLVASDRAPLGIAQTLCSMTPIFILPCVAIIHRERITFRATCGAVLAVGGGALLFLTA